MDAKRAISVQHPIVEIIMGFLSWQLNGLVQTDEKARTLYNDSLNIIIAVLQMHTMYLQCKCLQQMSACIEGLLTAYCQFSLLYSELDT